MTTDFANYGTDRLGNVTATTNAGGTLVNTYRYQPFGGLLHSTGSGRNPFRFTGTYLDGATGLYQMGARYYQPGTGRFTQQDPLGSSVFEANRYHYTNCNPTNYTDPSGLNYVPGNCGVSWLFVHDLGDGFAGIDIGAVAFPWKGPIERIEYTIGWYNIGQDRGGKITGEALVGGSLFEDNRIELEPEDTGGGPGYFTAVLWGAIVFENGDTCWFGLPHDQVLLGVF